MPDSPVIITARPVPVFTCAQRRDQQLKLLVAADQRVSDRVVQCLEPAADGSLLQHLPDLHRPRDTLQLDTAEIGAVEQTADLLACRGVDDDAVVAGQTLQAGGEIGRLADRRLLSCASPVPIVSPITTRPVAIPIRSRSLSPRVRAPGRSR